MSSNLTFERVKLWITEDEKCMVGRSVLKRGGEVIGRFIILTSVDFFEYRVFILILMMDEGGLAI